MTKRIITISREFGSVGRFIGEEVAKKLCRGYSVWGTGSNQNNGRYRQKAYDELQLLYRTEMGKSKQLYVVSE